jgi:predicted dehydrogenase
MLRIGIAGVGGLGTVHLRTLLKLSDSVRVDALADPIPERRSGKNLAAETNLGLDNAPVFLEQVRQYEDWSQLCNDGELDVIFIAMPSDLHAPAAICAMERGKHVFTEKPMALNGSDCDRMIDAAKANDRTLMVGQVLRFYPSYVAVDKIIRSGEYGKTVSGTMNRYGRHPAGWFGQIERSGGVNLDLHIHDIDAALWWWGKPDTIVSHTTGTLGAPTSVLSQWKYDDGTVVQMEATWDVGIPFKSEYRIVFEHATVRYDGGPVQLITQNGIEDLPVEGTPGHKAEVEYFIRCLLQEEPVARCTPEESALSVSYARFSDG